MLLHFFLFGIKQLINFQLTIQFLLKVLHHESHLSYVVFELFILHFHIGNKFYIFFELFFLFFRFGFELIKLFLNFHTLFFFLVVFIL